MNKNLLIILLTLFSFQSLFAQNQNNDVKSFMNSYSSALSGCSSIEPVITIQNYGLNNLTEFKIDVSVNGIFQYDSIINQMWDDSTNVYIPLNLITLDMKNVLLNPITDLVNGDIIEIDVSLPNGVIDTDPSNNGTMFLVIDVGFDNAYWDGDLSITVSGSTNNSWYLKKVSNNQIIAAGLGGVTGVNNFSPLEFNECYILQNVNGVGVMYTVTDFVGNIILQGITSQIEEFDNFTTGNQIWSIGPWDCINGMCIDPGTGNGTYSSLTSCQSNCVDVTYDCVNLWNGNACIDPGTGNGIYTTQAACIAVCGVNAIEEHTTNKELLKITDILGREVNEKRNTPLFYIYNDGTVEKKIIIE